MKINRKNPQKMAAALKRIPLQKIYDACNRRFFYGKMPRVRLNWLSGKDAEFMPEGAQWSHSTNSINFRLSAFARNPDHYQVYRVLVHEMIHAYIDLVLKEKEYRLFADGSKLVNGDRRKDGRRIAVHHGELFGREARRIAAMDGSPKMSFRDCAFGREGKKWAMEHGLAEQDDGTVIPYAEHVKARRKMRAERRKEMAEAKAWQELWGEWATHLQDEAKLGAEQFFEGDNYATMMDDEKEYPFAFTPGHRKIVSTWKDHLASAEAEEKRRKKGEEFRARLSKIPVAQQIEGLRKQLANPRTPKQFIPRIEAKLRELEGKAQTSVIASSSPVEFSEPYPASAAAD